MIPPKVDKVSSGPGLETTSTSLGTTKALTACPGDKIHFSWQGLLPHNVIKVSAKSAERCAGLGLGRLLRTGASPRGEYKHTVTGDAGSTQGFVCGVPGHCGRGQKLIVTVADAASCPAQADPTSGQTFQSIVPLEMLDEFPY